MKSRHTDLHWGERLVTPTSYLFCYASALFFALILAFSILLISNNPLFSSLEIMV